MITLLTTVVLLIGVILILGGITFLLLRGGIRWIARTADDEVKRRHEEER